MGLFHVIKESQLYLSHLWDQIYHNNKISGCLWHVLQHEVWVHTTLAFFSHHKDSIPRGKGLMKVYIMGGLVCPPTLRKHPCILHIFTSLISSYHVTSCCIVPFWPCPKTRSYRLEPYSCASQGSN